MRYSGRGGEKWEEDESLAPFMFIWAHNIVIDSIKTDKIK